MGTLVGEQEAARILSTPARTLAQWRFRRQGPRFLKLGRTVRYSVDDLNGYLESRVRGTSDQPLSATTAKN